MFEKKIPYLLLGLLVIYVFQESVLIFKPFAPAAGILVVVISLYYYFKILLSSERKQILVVSLSLLLLSYLFSFLLAEDVQIAISYLKHFIFVNFIFFPYFYFSKKKILKDHFFVVALPLFTLLYIQSYFYHFNQILLLRNNSDLEIGKVTNNVGYGFVGLLPFLPFIRKKIFRLFFYCIILAFTLYSAKRGAIIILAFSSLILLKDLFKEIKVSKYKYFFYVLVLVLLWEGGSLLNKFFMENLEVSNRFVELAEGNSSGRDSLFTNLINKFLETNSLFIYLFGSGLGATIIFVGKAAHNDWIELLVNNGVVGLVLLFSYYGAILKMVLNKCFEQNRMYLLICFFILAIKTLFSMSFTDTDSIPIIMMLGFFMGKIVK